MTKCKYGYKSKISLKRAKNQIKSSYYCSINANFC